MKVYVTKYALTKGIIEKEVKESTVSKDMVVEMIGGYSNGIHKPYWYENKDEAIAHAEKMKKDKLISLEKQIKKIEKIIFK